MKTPEEWAAENNGFTMLRNDHATIEKIEQIQNDAAQSPHAMELQSLDRQLNDTQKQLEAVTKEREELGQHVKNCHISIETGTKAMTDLVEWYQSLKSDYKQALEALKSCYRAPSGQKHFDSILVDKALSLPSAIAIMKGER